MKTEWGIFRKTDPARGGTPMENKTWTTRQGAEEAIDTWFVNGTKWLEARSREISDWKKGSDR